MGKRLTQGKHSGPLITMTRSVLAGASNLELNPNPTLRKNSRFFFCTRQEKAGSCQ